DRLSVTRNRCRRHRPFGRKIRDRMLAAVPPRVGLPSVGQRARGWPLRRLRGAAWPMDGKLRLEYGRFGKPGHLGGSNFEVCEFSGFEPRQPMTGVDGIDEGFVSEAARGKN